MVTGHKQGTARKAISHMQQTRVFVSRLSPVVSFTCVNFNINRLQTKFPSYSSFVITCDVKHKQKLLIPDEWEEGILLKPYVGKVYKDNNGKS